MFSRPGDPAPDPAGRPPNPRAVVGADPRDSLDEAERVRRREVSRALRKMGLPPEGEAAVERLSRSLVGGLLRGPIPEAMARAEAAFAAAGEPLGERRSERRPGHAALHRAPAPVSAPVAPDADRREAECRALLDGLREAGLPTASRRYGRGQTIYGQGEPAAALHVLTDGLVKLCRGHSGGKEATLRLLGAWDVFGDAVLGRRTAHGARAEAVTPCEVVKVPVAFAERAARERPGAAFGLATLLGLELEAQKEWVDCVLPRKADARLANLLALLARRFGEGTGEGTVVLPRLTHEELAQMIASSRESVTAKLNGLRRRGLIRTEGGRIVLPGPPTGPPRGSSPWGRSPA